MIKIILSVMVIAMAFSGCVGIDEPITKGHSMQINQGKQKYPVKNAKNAKNAKNINKSKK